ncbi:hypothetical protein ACFL6C_13650, partial [Myxococcota bacterium]
MIIPILLSSIFTAEAQSLSDWLSDTSLHADHTQTELFRDGYVDVQWFDGYNGFAVDPTGAIDSTEGIQAAIDAVYNEHVWGLRRAVLFTHQANGSRGEYLITDYLNCRQNQPGRSRTVTIVRHALVGELASNGERPLIRLKDNSTKYNSVGSPRPMVWYWSVVTPHETDPTKNDWDVNFHQSFRGIDLDLGVGNPGAIGIEFLAAEGSKIEDVTIHVRDSIAGIGDLATYGGFAVNVEIIGGDYAVKNFPDVLFNPRDSTTDNAFSQTMVGCRFINQNQAVFGLAGQSSFLGLVGSHISNTGSIPLNSGMPSGSAAGIVLERCLIEMGSPTTLIQNDLGRNIVIRDTYTKGIEDLILGGGSIADTTRFAHIKEFSRPGNGYYSLIDGAVSNGAVEKIDEGKTYAQQSLIDSLVKASKWDEATFPSYWGSDGGYRDSEVLNATTECISEAGLAVNVPVSSTASTGQDATVALQAAIDWAAANNKILFLGRGYYELTAPIIMRANSKLIGVDPESTVLLASSDWDPTSETPIVRTENSATSSAVLAHLSIRHYAAITGDSRFSDTHSHLNFTNLDWQLGKGSQVRDVHLGSIIGPPGWPADGTPNNEKWIFKYNRAKVHNNGGGRWWNVNHFDKTMWGVDTSIPFLMKNTHEPMYLYGWNG